MRHFQNIVVLVAMEVEAKAILKRLNLKPVESTMDRDLPVVTYQSEPGSRLNISLIYSGKCKTYQVDRIGKEAAVLMAWESIKAFQPDLVISAGTAGGFKKKGANIGDVYISNRIYYHDRLFHPVHELVDYGNGMFASCDVKHIAEKLGIKIGNVSTGNALMASQPEQAQMEKNNAELKEMEAAAIAEVAHLKNVPMFAIKTVTDFVDEEMLPSEQFRSNYKVALQSLSEKLDLFIQELAHHSECALAG